MQAVTEILAILMVYYDIREVLRRLIPGSPRERLITLSVLRSPGSFFYWLSYGLPAAAGRDD